MEQNKFNWKEAPEWATHAAKSKINSKWLFWINATHYIPMISVGEGMEMGVVGTNHRFDTFKTLESRPPQQVHVPLVHTGAELMHKDTHQFCEVIAIREGFAWCKVSSPYRFETIYASELVHRKTKEQLLADEMTNHISDVDGLLESLDIPVSNITDVLIKAGYRKETGVTDDSK